jgi:hypothetical protein
MSKSELHDNKKFQYNPDKNCWINWIREKRDIK